MATLFRRSRPCCCLVLVLAALTASFPNTRATLPDRAGNDKQPHAAVGSALPEEFDSARLDYESCSRYLEGHRLGAKAWRSIETDDGKPPVPGSMSLQCRPIAPAFHRDFPSHPHYIGDAKHWSAIPELNQKLEIHSWGLVIGIDMNLTLDDINVFISSPLDDKFTYESHGDPTLSIMASTLHWFPSHARARWTDPRQPQTDDRSDVYNADPKDSWSDDDMEWIPFKKQKKHYVYSKYKDMGVGSEWPHVDESTLCGRGNKFAINVTAAMLGAPPMPASKENAHQDHRANEKNYLMVISVGSDAFSTPSGFPRVNLFALITPAGTYALHPEAFDCVEDFRLGCWGEVGVDPPLRVGYLATSAVKSVESCKGGHCDDVMERLHDTPSPTGSGGPTGQNDTDRDTDGVDDGGKLGSDGDHGHGHHHIHGGNDQDVTSLDTGISMLFQLDHNLQETFGRRAGRGWNDTSGQRDDHEDTELREDGTPVPFHLSTVEGIADQLWEVAAVGPTRTRSLFHWCELCDSDNYSDSHGLPHTIGARVRAGHHVAKLPLPLPGVYHVTITMLFPSATAAETAGMPIDGDDEMLKRWVCFERLMEFVVVVGEGAGNVQTPVAFSGWVRSSSSLLLGPAVHAASGSDDDVDSQPQLRFNENYQVLTDPDVPKTRDDAWSYVTPMAATMDSNGWDSLHTEPEPAPFRWQWWRNAELIYQFERLGIEEVLFVGDSRMRTLFNSMALQMNVWKGKDIVRNLANDTHTLTLAKNVKNVPDGSDAGHDVLGAQQRPWSFHMTVYRVTTGVDHHSVVPDSERHEATKFFQNIWKKLYTSLDNSGLCLSSSSKTREGSGSHSESDGSGTHGTKARHRRYKGVVLVTPIGIWDTKHSSEPGFAKGVKDILTRLQQRCSDHRVIMLRGQAMHEKISLAAATHGILFDSDTTFLSKVTPRLREHLQKQVVNGRKVPIRWLAYQTALSGRAVDLMSRAAATAVDVPIIDLYTPTVSREDAVLDGVHYDPLRYLCDRVVVPDFATLVSSATKTFTQITLNRIFEIFTTANAVNDVNDVNDVGSSNLTNGRAHAVTAFTDEMLQEIEDTVQNPKGHLAHLRRGFRSGHCNISVSHGHGGDDNHEQDVNAKSCFNQQADVPAHGHSASGTDTLEKARALLNVGDARHNKEALQELILDLLKHGRVTIEELESYFV